MTGRDSESNTEQIRQASDIVDVVSAYVSLKRAGKDFKALCPFHQEKTPSFHVVPDKQIFKCFGCGVGGDVFKFIQRRENVGFVEALEILARRAGISLERTASRSKQGGGPGKNDLERVNRWACRWFREQLRRTEASHVRKYTVDRGISEESVQKFGLGWAPIGWESLCSAGQRAGISAELLFTAGLTKKRTNGSAYDAFRNRLMFPIHDAMDRVIGFGGRALDDDDDATYLNSPQSLLFDKRRCLYGLHSATEAFHAERRALVVEGYVDCIISQQAGFQRTVATLGTALTAEHCQVLRRYVDDVTLVFDSDEAGQRAADRSLGTFLSVGLDVRVTHVPEGKDPAEMLVSQGPEAFEAVLTSATDALEFKWNQVSRRYRDAATGPDRRRAVEEFLGLVAGTTDFGAIDPIQRGLILNQVGKMLGLSSEEVSRQLRITARRSRPARAETTVDSPQPAARPSDAATAAMQDLIEVLLNDASYYDVACSEFDPALLADGELKDIACAVREMARDEREVHLPRLISRFESVATARRIMALQTAGERRGNDEATVNGAVARLKALKEQAAILSLAAGLRFANAPGIEENKAATGGETPVCGPEADERARARAISDGAVARKTDHFAARKHLAAP